MFWRAWACSSAVSACAASKRTRRSTAASSAAMPVWSLRIASCNSLRVSKAASAPPSKSAFSASSRLVMREAENVVVVLAALASSISAALASLSNCARSSLIAATRLVLSVVDRRASVPTCSWMVLNSDARRWIRDSMRVCKLMGDELRVSEKRAPGCSGQPAALDHAPAGFAAPRNDDATASGGICGGKRFGCGWYVGRRGQPQLPLQFAPVALFEAIQTR